MVISRLSRPTGGNFRQSTSLRVSIKIMLLRVNRHVFLYYISTEIYAIHCPDRSLPQLW